MKTTTGNQNLNLLRYIAHHPKLPTASNLVKTGIGIVDVNWSCIIVKVISKST